MIYRMEIKSTEPQTVTIRDESGTIKDIILYVGNKYVVAPNSARTKKDRANKGRIVELLGFTDCFAPVGAIIRYLDNNRRGRVSPDDLRPYSNDDTQNKN